MSAPTLAALAAQPGLALSAENLAAFALAHRYPIAFWRLPDSDESFALIQTSPELRYVQEFTPANQSGFAISPFWPSEKSLLLLQPDLVFRRKGDSVSVVSASASAEKELLDFLNTKITDSFLDLNWHISEAPTGSQATPKFYTDLVQRGVAEIKSGALEKVVLSRFKEVNFPKEKSPIALWRTLYEAYPNTFASLISVPDLGTWIGATPELLLEVQQNRYFKTVALAGTQKATDGAGDCDVVWSQKEIEEQALVSRYIINCFKKIRLREYEEKGPRTITAGQVRHLKTTFSVDMEATGFPDLPGQMLALLHPTSAVGGMPREAALTFIQEQENYNRQLYSGYFGPVNIEGYSGLFVNLRCLQLVKQKALLYAGAGITQDSDPEKEWLETELKSSVLQRVLESLPTS